MIAHFFAQQMGLDVAGVAMFMSTTVNVFEEEEVEGVEPEKTVDP